MKNFFKKKRKLSFRETKRIILISLGVAILILGGAFLNDMFKSNLSGNVVSDLNVNFSEGQPISGTLRLILNQGELIPASSKVTFTNAGNSYEFTLSDLISEDSVSGNFYVEGKNVSGSGVGYGILGSHEIARDVDFSLVLKSKGNSSSNSKKGESVSKEPSSNDSSSSTVNNTETSKTSGSNTKTTETNSSTLDETPAKNSDSAHDVTPETTSPVLDKTPAKNSDSAHDVSPETTSPVLDETPAVENSDSLPVDEGALFDVNLKLLQKEISPNNNLFTSIGLVDFGVPGVVSANLSYQILDSFGNEVYSEEQNVVVETQLEFIKEIPISNFAEGEYTLVVTLKYPGQSEPASTRGNFVVAKKPFKFFDWVGSSFDRIKSKVTGQVSLDLDEVVLGNVSADNPYTLKIPSGQTAEILPGSVSSGEVVLSDDDVNLNVKGNTVSVTTDYTESDSGFGEDYLGDEQKVLEIDLSSLNLVLGAGQLNVSISYEGEDFVDVQTTLVSGSESSEVVLENDSLDNSSLQENVSENVSENISSEIIFDNSSLNETINTSNLVLEFENVSVVVQKEGVIDGRYVVRYELGSYWVEFSYDNSMDKDLMMSWVVEDRNNWLSDLSNHLNSDSSSFESTSKLEPSYPL